MLARQTMWVSGLSLALLAGAAMGSMASGGGPQVAQTAAPAQQPGVPDAPTPQALPKLNTITPVASAAPVGASTSAAQSDASGGVAPPSALPATAPTGGEPEDQEPPPAAHASDITVGVNLVNVPFTVKDSKNHLVPGLTWRDVRIYENGLRQSPKLFSVDPVAISVALVIDQSVTFDTMEKINSSLSALQGAFTPYDEVAVFTYNNGVTKQTDFTAAQSPRLGVILERSKGKGNDPVMGMTGPLTHSLEKNNAPIDGVPDPGHSAGNMQINLPKEYHTLNDAILEAATAASKAGKGRRRIVYVISDGKEYGSKATQKEVIKYLQTNKVAVYATLVGDASIPGMGFLDRIHLPLTMRDDVLPKYAAATGGQVDPEFRPRGIEASFAHIAEEVRTQYTIAYSSKESAFNEKFRKVEVRVMRPGLTVIAEEGYYPTASDNRPVPAMAPASTPAVKP